MVVAHRHQHAAERRRTGDVGVPEDVARAVHARPLAVPEAEDAVILALAAQFGLLAAPERRRRQILVQARVELDVRRLEELLRALERRVDRAERRSAIAGDISRRVVPRRLVARMLHQRRADQRLRAAQQHRRAVEVEAVGKLYVAQVHRASLASCRGHRRDDR
jgi:anti-sigma-K factor RskA